MKKWSDERRDVGQTGDSSTKQEQNDIEFENDALMVIVYGL